MLFSSIIPSIAAAAALTLPSSAAASEYHEQLTLRPLPPSSLLASFDFRANTTTEAFEQHNFRYFPRSLGQILQAANTKELHLRFSLGRWDAEEWGARPHGGRQEGGTGVEIWAWVEARDDEEAEKQWLTLTNALSGLFCASLNFIDSTRTTRPVMTFSPRGNFSTSSQDNLHLLHGTLPREVVCTENLTPFLKLLPCKGKAGISSLLDGHKLFDANWQSMSIDVTPITLPGASDGAASTSGLQISQTVDMVLDVQRSKRPRNNPIPRPVPADQLMCDETKEYHSHDTCFPASDAQGEGWALSEIFGSKMRGSCPLSNDDAESVCIEVDNDAQIYTAGNAAERKLDSGFKRCFKTDKNEDFELVLPRQDKKAYPLEQPPIYAERTFTGHGQEHGGVQAILRNPSERDVDIVYMESLPWFMKVYIHTLRLSLDSAHRKDLLREMYYRPALDRKRGTQLEMKILVPANSSLILSYDFEKAILRYTEYPPDANRGFDVPAAVVKVVGEDERGSAKEGGEVRTTALLLSLPTPDFSMPYNVIIFTSTVIALAFGFIFNLLVRRFVGVDEVPPMGLAAIKQKIVGRIQGLGNKFAKPKKIEEKIQ